MTSETQASPHSILLPITNYKFLNIILTFISQIIFYGNSSSEVLISVILIQSFTQVSSSMEVKRFSHTLILWILPPPLPHNLCPTPDLPSLSQNTQTLTSRVLTHFAWSVYIYLGETLCKIIPIPIIISKHY